ncbi:hypothetical protein NPIL_94261 [Nephila pilipes]|uniref:Uncharacterized protein n=1 Tax=Nephila pilipes TaxID=299642 RepID=A0A8X6URQ3_NEPPI|nr:hypothetical protein NPIL_94261 [Nephila pilipes]
MCGCRECEAPTEKHERYLMKLSEMSEYDITSDEEDSDCDYSLKDAQRWVQLETKFIEEKKMKGII